MFVFVVVLSAATWVLETWVATWVSETWAVLVLAKRP
jgi:hypothetical protein